MWQEQAFFIAWLSDEENTLKIVFLIGFSFSLYLMYFLCFRFQINALNSYQYGLCWVNFIFCLFNCYSLFNLKIMLYSLLLFKVPFLLFGNWLKIYWALSQCRSLQKIIKSIWRFPENILVKNHSVIPDYQLCPFIVTFFETMSENQHINNGISTLLWANIHTYVVFSQ